MEFEKQKSISDEFREGWERIYAQQEARKSCASINAKIDRMGHDLGAGLYPNGCPILSEGPQKDDL